LALNIKNDEAHRLARELAELKGVSIVEAVTDSLKKDVERERAAREAGNTKKGLAAWLMDISRETAQLTDDGRSSRQVMDELFDEKTGLPK
jgi:antitoxin VapB